MKHSRTNSAEPCKQGVKLLPELLVLLAIPFFVDCLVDASEQPLGIGGKPDHCFAVFAFGDFHTEALKADCGRIAGSVPPSHVGKSDTAFRQMLNSPIHADRASHHQHSAATVEHESFGARHSLEPASDRLGRAVVPRQGAEKSQSGFTDSEFLTARGYHLAADGDPQSAVGAQVSRSSLSTIAEPTLLHNLNLEIRTSAQGQMPQSETGVSLAFPTATGKPALSGGVKA